MPGSWYEIKHQGCVPSWAVSSVFILRALFAKCAQGALFFPCSKRCVNGAARVVQESSTVSSAGVELPAGTNANSKRDVGSFALLASSATQAEEIGASILQELCSSIFPLRLLFPKVLFKIGFPGRKR